MVPRTSSERRRGLLRHSALTPDEGLWIIPCEAIHTFGMRFAIDVLFLNSKKAVLRAVPRVPAGRIRFCVRAESVLELAEGAIANSQTLPGDVLQFIP
jgi:hypothetical protein